MNKRAKIQSIRQLLNEGKPTIGSWMQIGNSSVAEIMGDAGYDWIAVDLEHGSMSTSQLPDIFRALELGDTLALVRLAHGNLKEAKDALDAGAGGIIIPMIESAGQLHEMVQYSCWPPAGIRGVGFSRANLFGKYFDDYRQESQQPLIIAQIEHIKAVDAIDEILAVKGLDAIIIGPYDLSASMGITGEFANPTFTKTLERIIEACRRNNKPAGLHIVNPDPTDLVLKIQQGYQFIAYSIDSVFFNKSVVNPIVK